MDVTVQIVERNGRWDLKVGDNTFHFWGAQQLRDFATTVKANEQVEYDPINDPKYRVKYLPFITKCLRRAIKKQLETRTPAQIVSYLSTPRTLRLTDVGITVEEI